MQQFSFIDLFEPAVHVSGDRFAHLVTKLRWTPSQPCHQSAAILVHCTKAVYTVKSAPEDGQICHPKHVEQVQIDQ